MLPDTLLQRYSRNIVLPEIGIEGQERLRNGRVLVIGAGGLGCPALTYLAAAGVGTLGIVDGDVVDITNLQRQCLYTEDDIGKPKAQTAAERLHALNSDLSVFALQERLEPKRAGELFAEYDIIIDATDNFPSRYLINDACGLFGKPLVSASLFHFEGQITVFHGRKKDGSRGPTLRCLFPEPPGNVPNCSEAGIIGALPGILGSMQALEAIKIIAPFGEPLIGKLFLFQGLNYSHRIVDFARITEEDPEPLSTWDEYVHFCGGECRMSEIEEITPIALKKMLDAGEDFTLVDVREAHELEICKIGGLHIPLKQLAERASEIPMDKPVVFYCRSGGRSFDASHYFAEDLNHSQVMNLKGGILSWSDQVDPSMPKY